MSNPFFILYKMELIVWTRMRINVFWSVFWPILWMGLMVIVIPSIPGNEGERGDVLLYYYPSALTLILLSALTGISIRLAIKKEHQILRRFKVIPFSMKSYLFVQILCSITMSFISAVVVTILALLMKMEPVGSLLSVLLVYLLGGFTFSAIGFLIGGVTRKVASANIIGMIAMFLMMFLSDLFIPLNNIESTLYRVSFILPASPFLSIVRGILLDGKSLVFFGQEILIVTVWGVIAILLSIPLSKWD